MNEKVTVIIPTWKPGKDLTMILERLRGQSVPPDKILIVNTEEDCFDPKLVTDWSGLSVLHIGKKDFDHAGTRDMAARMADTPYIVFMTMDAIPADRRLIEHLLGGFEEPDTAAVYARQLPRPDSSRMERYVRLYSYPARGRVQSLADVRENGIKTFLCSDVCAAYKRDIFLSLGGFEAPAIFNEDMVFAGKAVSKGFKIVYAADAKVFHSHDYPALKQFRRNFDLGVSQQQHPEVFDGIKSEGTGLQMMGFVASRLARDGCWSGIFRLIWQSGWKYLGYRAGRSYEHLPRPLVRLFSLNRAYWK